MQLNLSPTRLCLGLFSAPCVSSSRPRYTHLCKDKLRVRRKTLLEKIASQIEYYFSDENLPYDKHMKMLLDTIGSVPVHDLLKFPALRQLCQVGHDKLHLHISPPPLPHTPCTHTHIHTHTHTHHTHAHTTRTHTYTHTHTTTTTTTTHTHDRMSSPQTVGITKCKA